MSELSTFCLRHAVQAAANLFGSGRSSARSGAASLLFRFKEVDMLVLSGFLEDEQRKSTSDQGSSRSDITAQNGVVDARKRLSKTGQNPRREPWKRRNIPHWRMRRKTGEAHAADQLGTCCSTVDIYSLISIPQLSGCRVLIRRHETVSWTQLILFT